MPFRVWQLNSHISIEKTLNDFEKTVKTIENIWITPLTTWEGYHVFVIAKFTPKPG